MTNQSEKSDDLLRTIESLSEQRHLHVKKEAMAAKAHFDEMKEDISSVKMPKLKKLKMIDEFNDNVLLLRGIFQDSQFDEIVYHLSNPSRLFVIQLMIGILRGMGFAIGILVIVFLTLYLTMMSLPASAISHLAQSILLSLGR